MFSDATQGPVGPEVEADQSFSDQGKHGGQGLAVVAHGMDLGEREGAGRTE